ncbi:MAG: sulfotransferase [Tepidisphaeraceae bacterium]
MKLIGIGFGRTGTMSLKAAIEELGFPCKLASMDHCNRKKEIGGLVTGGIKCEGPRRNPPQAAALNVARPAGWRDLNPEL